MQIAKLVLYSRRGEVRELEFKLGGLNILTGASKSGKSALIDIIDYCTGRGDCNVADGVIRKYVGWYAILFQLEDEQLLVARRNPEPSEKTSPDVYTVRGQFVETPTAEQLKKNITVDALEAMLGALLGISENEHRPASGTRPPLEANFRHALLFCFQDQNDIDSKRRLFHRQDEDFITQAIKDTLPYFLGAVDEDALLKQSLLDHARRRLRQLERQIRDGRASAVQQFPRGRKLLDEARQTGLLSEREHVLDEDVLQTLQRIAAGNGRSAEFVVEDGSELLAALRADRQAMRERLFAVNDDIRTTKTFAFDAKGYLREAAEQRARLSAVGLVRRQKQEPNAHHCPVCESTLTSVVPAASQIERALVALSTQLDAVQAENPRLQLRLARLHGQKAELEDALRSNHERMSAQVRENESLRGQQEVFVQQARSLGKIQQYLETCDGATGQSQLAEAYRQISAQIESLESEVDPASVREKLGTFLNFIGRYMTEYSESLDLEHAGHQLRLDLRYLTVIADTLDGPVPLYTMGSGENWVGYHVLAHLALHKWFRQKSRPVPGFIIFDQPSQAHYPPERDQDDGSLDSLRDEDQQAVLKLFALLSSVSKEIAPKLQVIVLDHADLKRPWFDDAVVERWRGGRKLIPDTWLR